MIQNDSEKFRKKSTRRIERLNLERVLNSVYFLVKKNSTYLVYNAFIKKVSRTRDTSLLYSLYRSPRERRTFNSMNSLKLCALFSSQVVFFHGAIVILLSFKTQSCGERLAMGKQPGVVFSVSEVLVLDRLTSNTVNITVCRSRRLHSDQSSHIPSSISIPPYLTL